MTDEACRRSLLRLIGTRPESLWVLRRLGGACFLVVAILAAIGFAVLATSQSLAAEPDATAFGWRMKEAKGSRPLLVIWVRQPDDTPVSEIGRRKQYYEELLFGRPLTANTPTLCARSSRRSSNISAMPRQEGSPGAAPVSSGP